MFGRKPVLEAMPVPLVVTQPEPVSIEAELGEAERQAYSQICEEIGFAPAALVKDKLLAFLRRSEIKVYPYEKVSEYLDSQFGKKESNDFWGHTWGWCPLREADKAQSDLPIYGVSDNPTIAHSDNGEFTFDRAYHGAVPLAVLCMVKDICAELPQVHFFVSDVMKAQDRKGTDPFLVATCPGMHEMLVIAEWDEPSFRSKLNS